MKQGTRVVRGPDWSSKKQDNGEGFLGTIIFVPKKGSSDNKVTVIWDSGRELRYRAGQDGKFDLRVYDNAPAGVVHNNIYCDGCDGQRPIKGIRWQCMKCTDFDLCTKCYMNDEHDISHIFGRIDTPDAQPISMQSREKSKNSMKMVKGLFPKAEVMRGPHWKWKNDDGGDGEVGKIEEIVTWNDSSYRGGVNVKWKHNDEVKTYRVGGEGCVDIIYTRMKETASGGYYYPEHLPVVDVVNEGGVVTLKLGDKVQVNLTKDQFKNLQDNDTFGGWDDGMEQCMTDVGTIVQMLFQGETCRVQYVDGVIWSINRLALTRKLTFSPGQAVRILDNLKAVKLLQEGHGGWNENMEHALGKVGRVIKVDNDGDIRAKIDNKTWVFNPVCVLPENNMSVCEEIPELTKDEAEADSDASSSTSSMNDVAEAIAQIFVDMLRQAPQEKASIVQSAGQGDLQGVKDFLKRHRTEVDVPFEGKTALQLASYEGHSSIVQLLLDNNADVNRVDKEGDTALHYAAFGKEVSTMTLLLNNKANINKCNKKSQCALHIAVGKASPECVRLLVDHGCDVTLKDSDGDTPMHDAISQKEGQPHIVQAVLRSASADYMIQNSKGFNALQWAVLKDARLAVNEILERNKSALLVNNIMKEGFTALHIAAANDYVEIISTLIYSAREDCDVDVRDEEQRTPLIIAVSQGHKRSMEVLITADCDVNAQDCNGNTALHLALTKKSSPHRMILMRKDDEHTQNTQIICALLEARADIYMKNKEDVTPLELASDSMLKQFMKLLAEKAKNAKKPLQTMNVTVPLGWEEVDNNGGQVEERIRFEVTKTDGGIKQKEYEDVVQKMMRTLPHAKIFKVERIQNKYYWNVYKLKKKNMEHQYGPGCSNELDLFHGTLPTIVDVICKDNLDFRLAGDRVGALFGKGTYFATEAKYSDLYAQPDENRHKYMFIVKVLAGKCTLGNPKYARPPKIKEKEPKSLLYDCCVDNVTNPKIYCVFDKNQYYPEYLVEYQ